MQINDGTLTIEGECEISGDINQSGGSVDAGAGTLTLVGDSKTIEVGDSFNVGNLEINMGSSQDLTIVNEIDVSGDLILTQVDEINGGTINVAGDVTSHDNHVSDLSTGTIKLTGAGDQVLSGGGVEGDIPSLVIAKDGGSITVTDAITVDGDLSGGGANISGDLILSGNSKTVDLDPDVTVENLEIDMGSSQNLTLASDLNVSGHLTITEVNQIDGGTINVAGNLTSNDSGISDSSSGTIRLTGAGDQIVSGGGVEGDIPSLIIAKEGGSITISEAITVDGDLSGGGANITGDLILSGNSKTVDLDPGVTLDNLEIDMGSSQNLTLAGDVNLTGDLAITQVYAINGGTINVAGNVISNDSGVSDGSTGTIRLTGSGDQILSGGGVEGDIPSLVIAKDGGTITISEALTVDGDLSGSGADISGDLILAGNSKTIDISPDMTLGNLEINMNSDQVLTLTGDVHVGGDLVFSQLKEFSGGAFIVSGEVSGNIAAIEHTGDGKIIIAGTGAETVTGTDAGDTIRGGEGDDVIDGGLGNDTADYGDADSAVTVNLANGTATGGDGSDTLSNIENVTGSDYNDKLTGDAGDNVLEGGTGNDSVYGGEGADVIEGGAGGDYLKGQEGDDTIRGGADNDTLYGGAGDDVLDGGEGTDIVYYNESEAGVDVNLVDGTATGEGSDTLINIEKVSGSQYDDTIVGDGNDNSLYGQDGDDVLEGGAGNDSLLGGAGNDVIDAGTGNDSVYGGAGDDVMDGGEGSDSVSFYYSENGVDVNLADGTATGEGTDTLTNFENVTGSLHDDTITGDDNNNVIYAKDGDDTISGGAGNDSVYAGNGADVVDGGAGNDYLKGEAGDDTISGGTGDDTLYGGTGDDVMDGGEGTDTVNYYYSEAGVDVNLTDGTATGEGSDTLSNIENVTGSQHDDNITGDDQINVIRGYGGNDVVDAGAGNDTVYAGDGDDTVEGGTGNDYLKGESGNDVVSGGEGDDTLYGGSGDDTLSGGAGNDYIRGESGIDTVDYSDAESSVTVDLSTTSEQDTGGAGTDRIYEVENLTGSAYDDTLTGNSGANVIDGGAGDDVIDSGAGDDQILGGAGADTISAGEGNDTVDGGAGDDVIDAGSGDNQISGGTGADTITAGDGSDVIDGGDDNDIINAGEGNNQIDGGAGDDSITAGAGADVIDGGAGDDVIDAGDGDNRISGGTGADMITAGDGSDVIDGGDDNDIINAGEGNNQIDGGAGDDSITAGAGVDVIDGGAGDDVIDAGDGDNRISGGTGADTITAGNGSDVIDGGAGDDVIDAGAGDDRLVGGEGDDAIDGGAGIDTVDYSEATSGVTVDLSAGRADGEGHDTLSNIENVVGSDHDDTISGDDGSNVLEGGAGDDQISGGGGDDTLIAGSGIDTLDGGGGHDVADYSNSEAGVTVNFVQSDTEPVEASTADSLINIEEVVGSGHDDTFAFGDPAAGASYTIDGGGGTNTLDLSNYSMDDATFDAVNGTMTIDLGGGETFTINYENLHTAEFSDATIDLNDIPPIAKAGVDQTVEEDGSVTLDGSASYDPHGEAISYQWVQTSGPQVNLNDPTGVNPSFTAPNLLSNTEVTFELHVTQGDDTTVDSVSVMINADNDAPAAEAGDDQTVEEGETVTLRGSGSDPEGQDLTYEWVQTGGPSVTLSDAHAAEPTFTAPEGLVNSEISFELRVSDGTHTSVDNVNIGVNADNDAPTADAGHDLSVAEGDVVQLSGGGVDPEGEGLTYEWVQTSGPSVTLSDAHAAEPTFTAPEGLVNSEASFELRVSDGTNTSVDTMTVTINADNDAPTADAGVDQVVEEGELVSLAGSGSDPEGEGLTYEWVQTSGPSVTLSDAHAAEPTFTAPEGLSNSEVTFELRVSDGTNTSVDTMSVTINADNDAPTADAGVDLVASEGELVTLSGSGTDPEGEGLTYEWIQTSGPAVTLSDATAAEPTFTAPEGLSNSEITFELRVSDGTNTSVDTMSVLLNANDDAPTADAGLDQVVAEGELVTLSGSGIDPEGEGLTYQWIQTSGPKVVFSEAESAETTFVAPDEISNSEATFELRVSDGVNTSIDSVSVLINADNDAPTAEAGLDQVVNENEVVTLHGGGVDPEGEGLTYEWVQTAGPKMSLSDASVMNPTFVAPEGLSNSEVTFELHVSDGTHTSVDTVDVLINADNDAPTAEAGLDQVVNENEVVTLHGGGVDPEGEGLTYEWVQTAGPKMSLSDASVMNPTFVAPEGLSNSEVTFELHVSDGTHTSVDTVDVLINADNDAPTAEAGLDQVVNENEIVTLHGGGVDPEGEGLTYEWVQTSGPKVELSDASVMNPTFVAPEGLSNSEVTFELHVSDGTHTSVDTVDVLINADNDAPTAEAGADQFVNEGELVTLSGSGSDVEGQSLTYEWVQTSGPEVVLSDPTSPTPTFVAPEGSSDTEISFELHVSDGSNTSVDTVDVTVANVHDDSPPLEVTIPEASGGVGEDGVEPTEIDTNAGVDQGDSTPESSDGGGEGEFLWDGTENLEVVDPRAALQGAVDFHSAMSPGTESPGEVVDPDGRFCGGRSGD